MEIEIGSFTLVDKAHAKAIYAEVTIYTNPESGGENVSLYLRLPHEPGMTLEEIQQLTRLEAIKQMRAAADFLSCQVD